MTTHAVVSDDEWLAARKTLLEQEKALTRARDELAAARRALPWRRLDTSYRFEDEAGPCTLGDLFDGRSQLVVYHFMYAPGWDEGCKSCSFWADQYDAMNLHIRQRDVALAVVSRAPWQDFAGFRTRMGWQFRWVSSAGTRFNQDFGVSFPGEDTGSYNYRETGVMDDMPGLSVFTRDDAGTIFHTYSCYSRGLDPLNATYQVLDLVPRGRDEADLPWGMAWLELHDSYDQAP